MTYLFLMILGLAVGFLSGVFGIGGGVFIIPALVFIFGFSQKMATGTTLAMMLPPIGLLAFIEYYKSGFVNVAAAIILVAGFMSGGYYGARFALKIDELILKRSFGAVLITVGLIFLLQKK